MNNTTTIKTDTKKLFVWDGNDRYWSSGLAKFLMENFDYTNDNFRDFGFTARVPVDFDPEKWIAENGK